MKRMDHEECGEPSLHTDRGDRCHLNVHFKHKNEQKRECCAMIVLQSHINIKTFSLNSQVGTTRESVVEAKQLSGLFLPTFC